MTTVRSDFRTLRSLLSTRDAAAIAEGVQRAVAAGPATVDALLTGTTYDAGAVLGWPRWRDLTIPDGQLVRRRRDRVEGRGTVRPGTGLARGNRVDAPWRLHAMLALISRGSGSVAAALREQITSLVLPDAIDLTLYDGLVALETLYAMGETSSVAGLAKLGRLRELIVSGGSTDLRGIEGAPSLTTLWARNARDLAPLRGLPRLTDLNLVDHGSLAALDGLPLERLEADHVEGLGDMPALEVLRGVSGDLRGLRSAPRLRTLCVQRDPCDLTHLPPLPALSDVASGALSDRSIRWFPMLPALQSVHRLDLSSWACLAQLPALRRAGGLLCDRFPLVSTAGVPAGFQITPAPSGVISQVLGDASRCLALGWKGERDRLESIADLGKVRGFDSLSLAQCKLTSLHGLAGSTITRLYLGGSAVTTLDGIEGLPLVVLDVRDCLHLRDASALARTTTLRVIAAAGCALTDEDFPEAVRWAIRREARPDLEALARRTPKRASPRRTARRAPPPAGAPAPDAASWAAIQQALSEHRDDAAVDLALRSGAATVDRLLRGLRYRETKQGEFQLVAKELRCEEPYLQHVLLRLVGEAPRECTAVAVVRDRVTALKLNPALRHAPRGKSRFLPVDLRPLARFPNLARVVIHADELHGFDALTACSKLDELRILDSAHLEPPERTLAFAAGTALRRLDLPGLRSLDGIEATRLEEVGARLGAIVLRGGQRAPRSTVLRVLNGACVADPEALNGLPALEELGATLRPRDRELRLCHAVLRAVELQGEGGGDRRIDLRGLLSLTRVGVGELEGRLELRLPPSVQLLEVGQAFTGFAMVSQLPRLRTLVLPAEHPLLDDACARLATHAALQTIESALDRRVLWDRARARPPRRR